MAKLSTCDRDHWPGTPENICLLELDKKGLATLELNLKELPPQTCHTCHFAFIIAWLRFYIPVALYASVS